MSSLEKRAWLMLWSMCPVYLVYFALLLAMPERFPGMLERISLLAVVASLHAVGYVAGLLLVKHRERGDTLLLDERDRAIDGRATRTAYFVMLTGTLVVGVVMPFNKSGWEIVNAALLVIVLSEAVRNALLVTGYRGMRFAH
ncbi:MAG TPA: hypothetical protein VFW82_01210 [Dyella sp.]|nr:hypothetical protein [Dyella sp.]